MLRIQKKIEDKTKEQKLAFLNNISNTANSYKLEIDNNKNIIDIIKNEIKNLFVIKQENENSIKEIEKNIVIKNIELKNINQELSSIYQKINEINNVINISVNNFNNIKDNNKKEISEMNENIKILKDKFEKENSFLNSENKALNKEILSVKNILLSNQKTLDNLNDSIANRKEELEKLNLFVIDKEKEIGDKNFLLNLINKDVENISNELNKLKNEKGIKSEILITLQNNINTLSENINISNKELEDKKMSIADILVKKEKIELMKNKIIDLYKIAGINIKL